MCPVNTIKTLFFKKNDYYSVIFWVRSIILDLTQNLDLKVGGVISIGTSSENKNDFISVKVYR